MLTSKLFSTISYNSKDFLVRKLDEMICAHIIDFYIFIEHFPEEDEKKNHKHLLIVPSSRVDTCVFVEKLREPDPLCPNNPLGCIRCVSSKFVDWYLYSIHDPDYLLSKGETRKYTYTDDDFVMSDKDYFLELKHTCDFNQYKQFSRFRDLVASGVEFDELLYNGFIPIHRVYQYEKAYRDIRSYIHCKKGYAATRRNGRMGHEPVNDDPTLLARYRDGLQLDNTFKTDGELPF